MKVESMANKFFIVKPNGQKFVSFVDITKTSWTKYWSEAWAFKTEKNAEEAIAMIRKIKEIEGRSKTRQNEQTATIARGK